MTSPTADSAMLIRVRKLLEKARASEHPHEAEAFARKAAELVARHRIDPERLAAHAGSRATDELMIREFELGRGAYVRARLALLTAIAEAHDSRVVFGAGPQGTVAHVAGHASDIGAVAVIFESLHAQAARDMVAERRSTAAATQRYRRAFLFGFAERMGELLQQSRRRVESEAGLRASGDQPTSAGQLALVERRRRVEEYAAVSFGRVRTARAASAAESTGWHAGASAAERADVGRARLRVRRAIGRGPQQ
jgi:hypothetical protein